MSYHFTFLSPRFNLAFLACDTRLTTYEGETRRIQDGVTKIQQISDFVWFSWNGFMPFAEAYAQWLRELWQAQVQSAKAPGAFLRDPVFHGRSRDFCIATFNRLKEEYQNAGVLELVENIHMIIVGMTAEDKPFFIAIDNGGPNIFDHTFVSSDLGEFPFVRPNEKENVLEWVMGGLEAILKTQANVPDQEEFLKRAQNISARLFEKISPLTNGVSSLCDCVVITARSSSSNRYPSSATKVELQQSQQDLSQEVKPITARPSGLVKKALKKVGRNDPCPCGSGKKFKRCHGK